MRHHIQFLTSRRSARNHAKSKSPTVDPRRWCLAVLSWALVLLLCIGTAVYIIDPFQVYRRPTWYKPVFIEAYSSIPGIIRHYDYDSIIVGSSMSQNFRISNIQNQLGWKSVKLTAAGCRPATGRLFITSACKRKTLQNVLYSLDIPGYTKAPNTHHAELPEYLYDDSPWNDYLYLWNQSVLCDGIPKVLKALAGRKRYRLKQDEDRMWSWDLENGRREYGAEAVSAKENERGRALKGDTLGNEISDQMRDNAETNLLSLVREHPSVTFVVFFPPYSIQAWYNVETSGNLDVYLRFKRETCKRLLACPNVQLFDFQADGDIICDFDNYKDGTHFSPAISRLIIKRISEGESRVQAESIAANDLRLRQLLTRYEADGPLVP